MRSLDVANIFIDRYGSMLRLTNLSLNKLVYLTQIESIKRLGHVLFDDAIEAWSYGPVEPMVYQAFKHHGDTVIEEKCGEILLQDEELACAQEMVDLVAEKYGFMSAYALVDLTHRPGGAWQKRYIRGCNNPITLSDIQSSADMSFDESVQGSLLCAVRSVQKEWPNALRMLEDS